MLVSQMRWSAYKCHGTILPWYGFVVSLEMQPCLIKVGGKKKSILACAVACALLSTWADTVAWWPLASESGVRTTVDTVIANVANPGTLDARPISMDGPTVLEGAGDHCPSGTNAFPQGWGVWNPQTRRTTVAETGLYFHKVSLGGHAGALRVDTSGTEALNLTNFTFEAFFRMQEGMTDFAKMEWNCIAVRPGRLYMENGQKVLNYDCWGVRVTQKNAMQFRFTRAGAWDVAAAQNNVAASNQMLQVTTPTSLYDGRWHHVALLVNGAARTATAYVDYKLCGTLSGLEPRSYAKGADDLYVGSTPQTSGCFGGTIAHVRISDVVLSPRHFLQFSNLAGAASGVPLHVDFEDAGTADVASLPGDLPNRGDGGGLVCICAANGYPSVRKGDVAASTVYPAYDVAPGFTNSAALANVPHSENTVKRYVQWNPQGDAFTNTSFTVECFYKTIQSAQYIPLVRRREPKWNVQFNLGFSHSPGHVAATILTSEGWPVQRAVADEEATNDGRWHHAALVVDAAAKTLRLYRDHREVGTSVVFADNLFVTPSDFPVCIGGVDNGNTFDGLIDDVRITMRALGPSEFLTTKRPGLRLILK